MNLLNAEQLHKHLLEDLENCESYSFAIAWVTNNDYYQSIYENIEKVEEVLTLEEITEEEKEKRGVFGDLL